MLDNNILVITTYISALLIGYLLGRIMPHQGVSIMNKDTIFSGNNIQKKNNQISIDDKKFVGEINTTGLQKKFDTIAETKNTTENISGAVDKLKNIKR